MMSINDRMEKRWRSLWEKIHGKGNPLTPYQDLIRRYNEPHRAYHTLIHIEHCLKEFDAVPHLAKHPDAVALALWYHDAVYMIGRDDNEKKSARMASKVILDAGLPMSFSRTVVFLIGATKKHDAAALSSDEKIIVDIDLAILGQPKKAFAAYERRIRKEYKKIPLKIFNARRQAILRSFLDRPAIYATRFFRRKYEARAQQNLSASLQHLSR